MTALLDIGIDEVGDAVDERVREAFADGSVALESNTTGNANVVQYQLTDATAGAGNTAPLSASTSVISGSGTGLAVAKTLQAKVVNYTAPATPDTYTDTVTMSVSY